MSEKRTLKYKIISKSENAPVVGSVIEEKDTIFVKQVSATEFEVYASDETGYVVKLDKTIDKVTFDKMVLNYIEEHSIDIRNSLNLTPSRVAEFSAWDMDIVFRHNDVKKIISAEDIPLLKRDRDSGIVYHYRKEDRLEIRGEDYPNEYILIRGRNIIIGKNIVDVVPIVFEEEEVEIYNGRNQYVLNAIQAEQIINRPINFTFQENGAPTDDLGAEFFTAIMFSEYADEPDFKKQIKTGRNVLYGIDGKLPLRVIPVEDKVLEISSLSGESLYKGMPNSQYSPIEIVDNIRDIVVNLRDERVGQGNVHFTIEKIIRKDIEVSVYPKHGKEDLKTIITDGDNNISYTEVGETYTISVRSTDSTLLNASVTIENAESGETLATNSEFNAETINVSNISKNVSRIKVVIGNIL